MQIVKKTVEQVLNTPSKIIKKSIGLELTESLISLTHTTAKVVYFLDLDGYSISSHNTLEEAIIKFQEINGQRC